MAQIEFLEWTCENHPRHSKFVGLWEDKRAKDVRARLVAPYGAHLGTFVMFSATSDRSELAATASGD